MAIEDLKQCVQFIKIQYFAKSFRNNKRSETTKVKMSIRAKKFIYANAFFGEPKPSDIQLVEEDLPALKNGEVLIEALYLSVDPYQRIWTSRMLPVGVTMIGGQVAK